jgi:hypothetical protein
MFFPFLLFVALVSPLSSFCVQITESLTVLKHPHTFKPNELKTSILKFDYGYSPEIYILSRREKIALKLTQFTKNNTEANNRSWQK